jgi:hypothetical protein
MAISKDMHWFVRMAIGVGIPAIACTGLYSLVYIEGQSGFLQTLVILAYPTVLIGIIGLIMTVLSSRASKGQYSAWALVIFIPLLLHLVIRIG